MDANDMRSKSIKDLQEELKSSEKELFVHRMQQSTGQLTQTHLLKKVSRDIARIKTFLNEKARQSVVEES